MVSHVGVLKKLLEELHASSGKEASLVEGAIRDIMKSHPKEEHCGRFCGLHSAMAQLQEDPQSSQLAREGLLRAVEVLLAADLSAIRLSTQLPEPSSGETTFQRLELSRQQCFEILAAGFFGVLHRRWSEETDHESRDMPGFNFSKLWQYDSERWGTKNFVLMAVLIFFGQASRLSNEMLNEKLTIIRKALGHRELQADLTFCPVEVTDDGVSIHTFGGKEHLQADFANSYLGGGVLSGGGTQEECMFTEFPELLASIYVTERMLPHEAVEIRGARRYVEHTMGARRVAWSEQFCRPTEIGAPIDAVALDAVSYGRRGEYKQYWSNYIQQDLRKCSAALLLPGDDKAVRRKFVTGLWGCGAFRGEPELKFLIQWISCSIEPSIQSMVFCPFDQKQKLIGKGLLKVQELMSQTSVKQVLGILEDASYAKSNDTFGFVLSELERQARQ